MKIEVKDIVDFLSQLLRAAENMGIILGETTDSQQAVQRPGPFITVDGAKFAPANRKLTIASLFALLNANMEGAVHRLELVGYLVDIHGRIHVLAVKIEMA